jgi:hypothetical protein
MGSNADGGRLIRATAPRQTIKRLRGLPIAHCQTEHVPVQCASHGCIGCIGCNGREGHLAAASSSGWIPA